MRPPRIIAALTIVALIAPAPFQAFAADEKAKEKAPAAAPAAPASSPDKDTFTASQLEQMIAPIALYPDSLLMQVLMASTYPLEVVEAARWLEANPKIKEEKDEKKIDEALEKEDWDVSVKSLVKFPDILKKMNENLDWTRDIGDAFLGQQAELLDAAQRMRGKAHEAGNLKSGKEQTVTVQEDKTIVIQQTDPEVIYVPSYNATAVYGPYWPPPYYYPSMYYYPPGAAFFSFGIGMMWGAAMWGGCSWGWGHSSANININNNINRNTNINGGRNQVNPNNRGGAGDRGGAGNRGGGSQKWQHNAEHRKGVGYKDSKTAQQFGGSGKSNRVSQSEARGRNQGGARPSQGAGAGNRPSTGNRAGGGAGGAGARPSAGNMGGSQRPSTGNMSRSGPSSYNRSSSAFSGSRNSSFDRASSSRGYSSRGMSGGGGRMGGGGGGRRR